MTGWTIIATGVALGLFAAMIMERIKGMAHLSVPITFYIITLASFIIMDCLLP